MEQAAHYKSILTPGRRHIARDGDTIVVGFPTPHTAECTETSCGSVFKAATWACMKQSLKRHLVRDHGIVLRKEINLCITCTIILGLRPTYHACAAPTQASPPAPPSDCRFACASCSASFPNKRGLINHLQAHDRQRLVETRAATHPLPTHQPPPVHQPAPPPPDSQEPPDEGMDEEEIVEDDALLAAHIANLRAIGRDVAGDENWNNFCQVMRQITADVQTYVKLPPPTVQQRLVREEEINDCLFIQKLYRRNRRRAVRLILEADKPRCASNIENVQTHYTST